MGESTMATDTDILDELLKLPPPVRAELAMALWDSLDDADQDTTFVLSPELKRELDRRWEEHLADPDSAIPWEEVRRKLRNRR
jgi:putative addiction module component (TIGR02574 family)